MVVAQMMQETDSADQMVLLTRNLLRIAIYHISYIRGLFEEKYFTENSVLSPAMKNEKVMPLDPDLGRLIDWMEKGVYDGIQKKCLKTVLFCISEKEEGPMIEEYAFSFSYQNTHSEENAMIISRRGSRKGITAFKTNASELTPDHIKRYGCKMIRALVSLMKTIDSKPNINERTILVKLVYYDDVTPEDYESSYPENEALNIWNKNPLKMQVGNVNSKHLALKVKGVLNPCYADDAKSKWGEMRVDDFSNNQFCGKAFGYVLCTSQRKFTFLLNSGATHHVCNDETLMSNLRKVAKKDQISLYSSDGKEFSAKMAGCIDLKNFSLRPVGLIPSMTFNVVSVGQLVRQGLIICCGNSQFSVYDMNKGKIIGEGYLDPKKTEYVFRTLYWLPESEKLIKIPQNDSHADGQEICNDWIIDTGCSCHFVGNVALLTSIKPEKRSFQTAKEAICSSHKGKVKKGKLALDNVLHCASVNANLMSGPLLDKAGYRISFCGTTCTLVHKDGLELRGAATLNLNNNLYYLDPEERKGPEEGKEPEEGKHSKRRRVQ